jgi:hypothetical protein
MTLEQSLADARFHRRRFGVLLGALVGLVFGVISQYINFLVLPGYPLYQPPLGAAGNTLLILLLGVCLGLIVTWAETGARGVILGCLFGALLIDISVLLSGRTAPEAWSTKIAAVLIIFVPIAGALAPLLAAYRWIASREEYAFRDSRSAQPPGAFQRFAPPAALVIVMAALGLTAMFGRLGRINVPRMQAMIEAGLSATSVEALPKPLTPEYGVEYFLQKAQRPYTLQWDKDEINRYAIPRPGSNQSEQSTVVARFGNGYLLACMYANTVSEPECRDFP